MLPRILCNSAGIIRTTQRQHNVLLFAGIGRPQARCLQPVVTPLLPMFRNLSTTKGDSASKSTSDAKKTIAQDSVVKYQSSISSSAPSTAPSVEAGSHKIKELDPKESESVSSTIPSSQISSSPASIESPASATRSTGESPTPVVSLGKADAIGETLATYYEKAFRLWTERSGTKEILALKESVNEAGAAFDTASAAVTKNRRNLDDALRKWERASGQHLQLLQRRESWTPEDAQRFADFVSLEITSRSELEQARVDLGRSEELLTKSQLDYINKMRRRYHEEQIWQDQWRVLGTYGTWSLIVLNSCVFLGSQFFQRRRERERTETIERLIRESRSDDARAKEQTTVGADREAATEVPTTALVEEVHTDENNVTRTKVEGENPVTSADEPKPGDLSTTEKDDTTQPEDKEPNHRFHRAIEKMGTVVASVGSFANRLEQKLPSKAKELAGSINKKLKQALPAEIANEMPKSVSEIHVPSAIIGASVGGIAALTISMILSSLSNRKH